MKPAMNATKPNAEEQKPAGQTPGVNATEIRYLTPDNAEFSLTPGGLLMVRVGEEVHQPVYLHCSFPHTNRKRYISVRNKQGAEVGLINHLDEFPDSVVQLLEEQIRLRYFAPKITKIVRIKEEFGYSFWETETTAGFCRFTVRRTGGNVRMVTDRKVVILDVDGNRFEIEDIEKLSEKEYRMIEMFL